MIKNVIQINSFQGDLAPASRPNCTLANPLGKHQTDVAGQQDVQSDRQRVGVLLVAERCPNHCLALGLLWLLAIVHLRPSAQLYHANAPADPVFRQMGQEVSTRSLQVDRTDLFQPAQLALGSLSDQHHGLQTRVVGGDLIEPTVLKEIVPSHDAQARHTCAARQVNAENLLLSVHMPSGRLPQAPLYA
jgi:hypothetical protein